MTKTKKPTAKKKAAAEKILKGLDNLELVGKSFHEDFFAKNFTFDFGTINATKAKSKISKKDKRPVYFGTVGCKMQLFPLLFPNTFKFNMYIVERYDDRTALSRDYFQLLPHEYGALFYPGKSDSKEKAFKVLNRWIYQLPLTATEKEVNDNILLFVRQKRKEILKTIL